MTESKFQKYLINKLNGLYPECIILKNDSSYIQGIPDLIVLYNDKWIALEIKKMEKAAKRPNQQYYIDKLRNMSYAAFVNPSNIEEVLYEIQQVFSS